MDENNIVSGLDWLDEMNRLYPNRHNEIHKVSCQHCPSAKGTDPESEEIKTYSKELIVKEFLFVCAWRESKLCKGLCDKMGIDEKFIEEVRNKTTTTI